MALNFRRLSTGIQLQAKTLSTASLLGEMDVDSTANRLNFNNGTSTSGVLTISHAAQGTSRIQNKDLEANTLAIVDSSDTTKKILFQVSGASTGFTTTLAGVQTANRVLTLPDVTDTLAVVGASQIFTNKLLDEASVWFVDHTDTTKAFKFDVSGAGTGKSVTLSCAQAANIVLTLPVTSDTLVGRATTDTLTNKTLTSAILNTPTADTITAISGGPLTLLGTLGVFIQDIKFSNDNISGASTADLTIQTLNNKNLQLSPNGTGLIVTNAPTQNNDYSSWVRSDDNTTTGSNAVLTSFGVGYIKVTNSSLASLSGIPSGMNGQILFLTNGTGGNFLVNNQDSGVTANERIITGTNNFLSLSNDASVIFIYDTGVSRWRIIGGSGSGGSSTVFGGRGAPKLITTSGLTAAGGNMSTFAGSQLIFVAGNGGPVTVTSSSPIQAGTIVGQLMTIVGQDATNTLTFLNTQGTIENTGLEMNGNITLGLDDVLSLFWDGTSWIEISRSK